MSKRLLEAVLSLTLCAMPLIGFAMDGNGSSGGGDGVYVENELVMRDFLEQSGGLETVSSNGAFLRSIKGFRELMDDVANVHPTFASDVINDLMSLRIYLSSFAIPKLPSVDTAVVGKEADVQVATRIGKELIIAPSFFEIKTSEYLLLHEALHGLLSSNNGPLHHHRVRNIVSYIFNNRLKLVKEDFDRVLKANRYWSSNRSNADSAILWNKQMDVRVKCFTAVRNFRTSVSEYLANDCSDTEDTSLRNKDLQMFVEEKAGHFKKMYSSTGLPLSEGELSGDNTPFPSLYSITDRKMFLGVFASDEQRYDCEKNYRIKKELESLKRKYLEISSFAKGLYDKLFTQELQDEEKRLILEIIPISVNILGVNREVGVFKTDMDRVDSLLESVNDRLALAQERMSECRILFSRIY